MHGSRADRKRGIAEDAGAFLGEGNRAGDRCELLAVQAFDLLAQIEALLRRAQEYQREVERFREQGGDRTGPSSIDPVPALQRHIREMEQACSGFAETLADIHRVVDSFDRRQRSSR